ncbi:TetR/AcrR family transcriptional regulator [Altericroceibacterium spongiae]|uniref:TetR/AcrR family transcriptional regulator n=1 Tax=Altericroceibacterium spongiae TaxID=2320269 RepID=A0A420ECN2_9SPHN|nr:TetR/AcrR family transcriptional regulator [Altericroceibacterium spongiae]RKF18392.1 TetR/AcrR family transcriptional regulator [Altericroceibacterium spongiae]
MNASPRHRNGTRLPPRSPKGGRPTQEIAARLRTHILDVALERFIAHGPEMASMNGIAAAANVSKRTLYSRFQSKIGLLMAAIEHGIEHQLDDVTTHIPEGSIRKQILYLASGTLDTSLQPRLIGLQSLIGWLIAQNQGHEDRIGPGTLVRMGQEPFVTLLHSASELQDRDDEDIHFLAAFLFDALVTAPRRRILERHDLANTPEAKSDFQHKTLNLIAESFDFLSH